MKLAILIPTLSKRAHLLERVKTELYRQIAALPDPDDATVITLTDNGEQSTGEKRNELIELAIEEGAQYISFVDDDDMIGETYVKRGIEVADSGMDCGELWGQIYWEGKPGKPFHHSIIHKDWWEDNQFYYRMPNHLNFQKLSAMHHVHFPDQVFGEDGKQSYAMRDAGVLKTMYPIPEIIYHYYVSKKK